MVIHPKSPSSLRLGGYLLFGNNVGTLPEALRSLQAVADDIVAIDSGATDGSAQLVDSMSIRRVLHPWRGYGAARQEAVRQLASCDYIFSVDADERLAVGGAELLRAWKASSPGAPAYRVWVNDWVGLGGRRFRLRSGTRIRLLRPSAATFTPEMIVHESVGLRGTPKLPIAIDHEFVTSLEGRREKQEQYAWLWALQAFARGRRAKPSLLQRPAHWLKDVLLSGALFRGGLLAARVGWEISAYHALKYDLLRQFRSGRWAPVVAALSAGRLEEVFAYDWRRGAPFTPSEATSSKKHR